MTRILRFLLLQPMRPMALLAALCLFAIGLGAFGEQYRQTALFGATGDIGAALDRSWPALAVMAVLALLTRFLPLPMLIATGILLALMGGEIAGDFFTTNRVPPRDVAITLVLLLLAVVFLTVGFARTAKTQP